MSLMCLFLWLDYDIDIVDFENFDVLVYEELAQKAKICVPVIMTLAFMNIKFSKMDERSKFFFILL